MMFGECITISDDEDEVQVLEQIVNLEPYVIDLTNSGEASQKRYQQPSPNGHESEEINPPQSNESQDQESGANFQASHCPNLNNLHNGHPVFTTFFPNSHSPQPQQPASQPNSQHPSQSQRSSQQASFQASSRIPSPTYASKPPQPSSHSQDHLFSRQSQQGSGVQPQPQPQPPPQQPKPPSQQHQFQENQPSQQPSQNHQPPDPQQTAPTPNEANRHTTTDERPQQQQQQQEDSHQPQQQQDTHQPQQQTISDQELLAIQKRLGNEKYKNNLFDEAIRIYKRAILLANKIDNKEMSAILHFNLAMTYDRLRYHEQAVDECANAVKINASYLKAHQKRADILVNQRKFDEAVICYEHLCELDSNNQYFVQCLNSATQRAKQTRKKDCFEILGLNSNFTREDAKKAYRRLALLHHPDRHSDADIVTRRIHEKRFKDAAEAYSFLQTRYGR